MKKQLIRSVLLPHIHCFIYSPFLDFIPNKRQPKEETVWHSMRGGSLPLHYLTWTLPRLQHSHCHQTSSGLSDSHTSPWVGCLCHPFPLTSTSHSITHWSGQIIGAPVSGISPELVGSAEIYVYSSSGADWHLLRPEAEPSAPVGGCGSVCARDVRLDEHHEVSQKTGTSYFCVTFHSK